MNWISIEEKLPKESDNLILVCIENGLIEIVWISDEDKCTKKPFAFDEYDTPIVNYENIKYWQPLPKAPK